MKTSFTKLTREQLQKVTGGADVIYNESRTYTITTPPLEPPLEDDGNRGSGRP